MEPIEPLRFLRAEEVREITGRWGTPVFVYDEASLREQARQALAFAAPFGLTVRYAMKANPHREVLRMLHDCGIAIDASSGFEAELALNAAIAQFADETGRQLHLEIEPGTFLIANAGSLLTTIHDIVDTGPDGYRFLKIDSGMTDILRPTLYAAQHPLVVVNDRPVAPGKYVVVGHCCESTDLLTPHPDDPEVVATRWLQRAEIGDPLVIEGAGAYCASLSAHGYNSFPKTPEVLRRSNGQLCEITD